MIGKLLGGGAGLLALGLFLGYGTLVATAYFSQARMLFLPDLPTRAVLRTPASVGLPFEEVSLVASDGVSLHGWYLPHPGAVHTLLFCHGNAGNISHRLDSLEIFHELGLSVLIFDYRGYGKSGGVPSEAGSYRDVKAAWAFLVGEKGVPPDRVILYGRSLGAAVAAALPDRNRAAALILESAFTSVPDLAQALYPWLPARWLSRYRYDTLGSLGDLAVPLLVVHSRDDEIIPFSHGKRLFDGAPEPKQLLELRGGHNDAFLRDRDHYLAGLRRFLETLPEFAAPAGGAASR